MNRKSFLRRVLFFTHLWTGVVFGAWFAFVGLTGAVLAWTPSLVPRELVARYGLDAPRPGGPVPPSVAQASVAAAHPAMGTARLTTFISPYETYPYYIWFIPNPKSPFSPRFALVDPNSGRLKAEIKREDTVMGWVVRTHTDLLQGPMGIVATGAFSVFALLSIVSGVWLWWPKTREQIRLRLMVKRGAALKRVVRDLHNVLGMYLLLPLTLTTLTAILMVYSTLTRGGLEKAIDRAAGTVEAKPPVVGKGPSLGIDALLASARTAAGDGKIVFFNLPVKPGMPATANYQIAQDGFLRSGVIALDPSTGRTLSVLPDAVETAGHRATTIIADLHLGQYGGTWTRVLYTLAGLMPLGLYVTGLVMWGHRKRAERQAAARRGTQGAPPSPSH